MSLSKQAVHIINATNGLCAHPIHYHSFTAVGSSSLFAPAAGVSLFSAPKCLFVGTFHKCIACHNRLGSRPQKSEVSSHDDSSSGMEMLCCVACGVYAHRSCAFALTDEGGSEFPGCEVNKPFVQSAFGLIEQNVGTEVPCLIESPKLKSSWSIFGREHADDNECIVVKANGNSQNKNIDPAADENTHGKKKHNGNCQQNQTALHISTQHSYVADTGHKPLHPNQCGDFARSDSTKEKWQWHFFGRTHGVKIENEDKVNDTTKDVSPNQQPAEQSDVTGDCNCEHTRTWCPHVTISRPKSPTSWSIFSRKSARNHELSNFETREVKDDVTDSNYIDATSIKDDELPHAHGALTPEQEPSEQKQASGVPPVGAFRTSIDIIRKTSQTTANIPKAYSIGMVAGGVAGLAIAGPAG